MTRPTVSVQWLNDHLNDPDLIVLDASQASKSSGIDADLKGIRIKGARKFDLKNTFSDTSSPLPNMLPSAEQFETESRKLGINTTHTLVIYDDIGIYFSPRVWWMFKTMGHSSAFVLDGGLAAWTDEGYETEPISAQEYSQGNFTAVLDSSAVKDFEFIENNSVMGYQIVIDARSSGRFNGTAPEPRKNLRSGHIPNSINIPYETVLQNGKLRSKEDLIEVFKKIPSNDKPLVYSCGSGVTACIVLLAHDLISNKNKSVYDGSWTEWATRTNGE